MSRSKPPIPEPARIFQPFVLHQGAWYHGLCWCDMLSSLWQSRIEGAGSARGYHCENHRQGMPCIQVGKQSSGDAYYLGKGANTLDVRSQVELVRLFSETPPAKSIYWEAYSTVWDLRAGGVSYQVSVSIRNKVAMSVSTAPIDSVHVDVSCREYVEGSLWNMSGGEAASWTPFN